MYHYTDEAKLAKFMVSPLLCELILLMRIFAIE